MSPDRANAFTNNDPAATLAKRRLPMVRVRHSHAAGMRP